MQRRFPVEFSPKRAIGESRPAFDNGPKACRVVAGRRIGRNASLSHLSGETGGRQGVAVETGSARNLRRPGAIALGFGSGARATSAVVYVEIFASAHGTER